MTVSYDFAQANVVSGNSYTVPGNGRIISWSHNASSTASQSITLKVLRKVADPNFYEVVGLDGPRPLDPGLLNTFSGVDIPVKSGDLIGARPTNAFLVFTGTPGDTILVNSMVNVGLGQQASFVTADADRLNLTAVFEPSNAVTLGKTALNKKKGTATLNLTLPNSGDLTASGKGVKASSASAVTSKAVPAGAAKLVIKAKGKQKQSLYTTGKVTLKVAIKFTPAGGEPGTKSVKVKLKKTG
jgi:hypothetical protein